MTKKQNKSNQSGKIRSVNKFENRKTIDLNTKKITYIIPVHNKITLEEDRSLKRTTNIREKKNG